METRQDLYPPIEPNDSGMLPLDDIHTMYWETSGNPRGIPVLFVHGGPGGGCAPEHRRFFDPERFRIVLFDQRGCGASTPFAEVAQNSTPHLVNDIERLRDFLGISQWLMFGGSWGSTLALAYGQSHPDRCLGFVLRGIFLGRASEIEWFLKGARQVQPDAWRRFVEMLPPAERDDILRAYLKRLFHADPKVHLPFARAWSEYEGTCSTLLPHPELGSDFSLDALALARLEAHYFAHQCFFSPNQLLANLYRIAHLPAAIVHGRYDMVCPIISADELARAWSGARFTIIDDAGHSVWEPGITRAMVREVEWFKTRLSPAFPHLDEPRKTVRLNG